MNNEDATPEEESSGAKYFSAEHAEGPVEVTAQASIVHQDDYPKYEIAQGVIFCPVVGSNLSLNFVTFPPNSGFPSHVHAEEQISIVREGEMEITIHENSRIVKPGDVIIFPPNVPHAGRTSDHMCRLIDIFAPPRQGMEELIARANPVRSAEIDRWWQNGQ
jgi:quercetin dioxygenase-like cupin family protein